MAQIIDTIEASLNAVATLAGDEQVAITVSGVHMCREGRISSIHICRENDEVHIFDITCLGSSAFELGGLGGFLENPHVLKVLFEGRVCNDALQHLFGVTMQNVYDLQVLHALKFKQGNRKGNGKGKGKHLFVDGFKTCLEASQVVAGNADWQEFVAIKERGKVLFAEEKGGTPEVWEMRPLHPDLIAYANIDVKYMLKMKRAWESPSLDVLVKERGAQRIRNAIEGDKPARGKHMAIIDFQLGVDASTSIARELPKTCCICLGDLCDGRSEGLDVRPLPCAHAFHEECIANHIRSEHRQWLESGMARQFWPKCPECRQTFPTYNKALATNSGSVRD